MKYSQWQKENGWASLPNARPQARTCTSHPALVACARSRLTRGPYVIDGITCARGKPTTTFLCRFHACSERETSILYLSLTCTELGRVGLVSSFTAYAFVQLKHFLNQVDCSQENVENKRTPWEAQSCFNCLSNANLLSKHKRNLVWGQYVNFRHKFRHELQGYERRQRAYLYIFVLLTMYDTSFSTLWGALKLLLLLSHGQASFERGFSVNKCQQADCC